MEIALTGFNPQASTASVDLSRQQQNAQQQERQAARSGRQADADQRTQGEARTRAESSQRTPETSRIINGEVLSSESTRVSERDSSYSFLASSNRNNQQAPTSQPDTRRIPVQQALENFQQNDDIVSDSSNPRQVSGIIDEFV